MKDWIGKFIHNCIAHPAICFLPKKLGDRCQHITESWGEFKRLWDWTRFQGMIETHDVTLCAHTHSHARLARCWLSRNNRNLEGKKWK